MERWLSENISKYSDDKNKDLIDKLFNELLNFIKNSDDLYLEDNLETFKINFYNLMYYKYS